MALNLCRQSFHCYWFDFNLFVEHLVVLAHVVRGMWGGELRYFGDFYCFLYGFKDVAGIWDSVVHKRKFLVKYSIISKL